MSTDLKKIYVISQPLFTVAEKRRIVVEAATMLFVVVGIIVYFSLLTLCSNTPEPVADTAAGKGVAVWEP